MFAKNFYNNAVHLFYAILLMLDGTVIDQSGILTIEKGNESLLSKRPS